MAKVFFSFCKMEDKNHEQIKNHIESIIKTREVRIVFKFYDPNADN